MGRECKACGAKVLDEAAVCPACGAELAKKTKLLPLAAFMLIVILVIQAYMDKPEPEPAAPAVPAAER
jgi:uncharacterized OB-fold protein